MSEKKAKSAEPQPNPAYRIVEPMSVIVRWSRLRFYELIAEQSGVRMDRSAITILDMLWRKGPVRLSELAMLLGLDRSTVSRQVASVVAAGLARRDGDASDQRAALLSLTNEGSAIRQKLAHAWHSIAIDLVADWPYEEQVEVARLLAKLVERLEDQK
jgi:DNA-binding MarR family transcriptional regulator